MVKIVAEVGLNHNGDVDVAKALIKKAATAGCDYVKFQKRTLDLVMSEYEANKPRESPWGSTYGDYRKQVEFELPHYLQIDKCCREEGIQWFASIWDTEAYDFITGFSVPFVKIPSALITDLRLLDKVRNGPTPVIISTGMSDSGIVGHACRVIGENLAYVLQCTSSYPAPLEEINLKVIPTLAEHLRGSGARVGFSNHTTGVSILPAAVALGAEMIEFHVTLDRSMYGTDQSSSIEDINRAVRTIRQTEMALGISDKQITPSEMAHMKRLRFAVKRDHFVNGGEDAPLPLRMVGGG